jgi:hypothetical protein
MVRWAIARIIRPKVMGMLVHGRADRTPIKLTTDKLLAGNTDDQCTKTDDQRTKPNRLPK